MGFIHVSCLWNIELNARYDSSVNSNQRLLLKRFNYRARGFQNETKKWLYKYADAVKRYE